MSNDRELLELAAKAHGGVEFNAFMNYPIIRTGSEKDGDQVIPWNPLDDDGDALRLAVKLAEKRPGESFSISISISPMEQFIDEDVVAATRRAIVQAAAEIWKAMS